MAINTEKLYELACENLRGVCAREDLNYDYVVMHIAEFKGISYGDTAAALEIYLMAKDELGKAKGGTAYSAVKRFIKGCSDSRPDYKGVWYDAEDHQCMCDGYHALRLKNHVEGFNTVKGMDLERVYPKDHELVAELPMPTPGELKINKRKLTTGKTVYDFGDGLPCVNANYLKNIMDCLPDAKAYVTERPLTGPIIFKSDKGDALLLPIRKRDVA